MDERNVDHKTSGKDTQADDRAEGRISPSDIELSYDQTGLAGQLVGQLEDVIKEMVAADMNADSAGQASPSDDGRAEIGYDPADPVAIKMINCALGTLEDIFTGEPEESLKEIFLCFVQDELDAVQLEDAGRTARLALRPLAALELLPEEFPTDGRRSFVEFARAALPAYEACQRVAEAIRDGSLASERVPIFVDRLGPCLSPVVGDSRRRAYGSYLRDAQREATRDGRRDPTAVEAVSYVSAWFSTERMERGVARLEQPGALDAMCARYPALQLWSENPQGANATWLLMSERLARGEALPERGNWFEWH